MAEHDGKDLNVPGSTSSKMPPSAEDLPSATPSLTGLLRTLSTTSPNTKSPTTLFTPRDTHPLEMPRIPSPSPKMVPPNSSTSNSRETRPHGSTMPLSVRDVSSVWPMPTVPPRRNAVSTSAVPRRPGIAICGWLENPRSRSLKAPMPPFKSRNLASPLSWSFMPPGANSLKRWRKNMKSLLLKLEVILIFTASVETRNVNLSKET
mmetsp:Transcript_56122/g.157471  ORF Transcript_56122/g.157471 Transcript_56122/m.157471 type:complete len:206 (-) Transcript_56122:206-823(-)